MGLLEHAQVATIGQMTFTTSSQKAKKDSSDQPVEETDPPSDAENGEVDGDAAKKAKAKAKAPRAASEKKADASDNKTCGGRVVKKRGPPRPHKRLAQEILDVRLGKLRNRIEKAKGQLEDAERHIDSYEKESKYRKLEAANPDAKL